MVVYKWSWAGLCLLMALSMAGCSTEGETPRKEEKSAKEVQMEEDPQAHKIKSDTVSKTWKMSNGKVMAHGAAEIKNTGKKPVQLDSARLRFLGKDDRQLVEKEVLTIVPKVIQPGESRLCRCNRSSSPGQIHRGVKRDRFGRRLPPKLHISGQNGNRIHFPGEKG